MSIPNPSFAQRCRDSDGATSHQQVVECWPTTGLLNDGSPQDLFRNANQALRQFAS